MMRIITPRRISWIGPIVIDLHVKDFSIDEREEGEGMGSIDYHGYEGSMKKVRKVHAMG